MTLNRYAGRCVIPIGRHSLMNGVGASAAQLRSEIGAQAFADQLTTFFGTTIVQRNLTELGFDTEHDTRLADYLDAVKGSVLSPTPAFEALLSAATDPRPESGPRAR